MDVRRSECTLPESVEEDQMVSQILANHSRLNHHDEILERIERKLDIVIYTVVSLVVAVLLLFVAVMALFVMISK